MRLLRAAFLAATLLASSVKAMAIEGNTLETRAANSTRYVFAHLIVGITSVRQSAADWDADMIRAKSIGIDAFALNLGTNDFNDKQLGYAYTSAANNGMKLFLSFDFNWWSTGSAAQVGQKIAQYAGQSAQLMVDGKVFVSTFVGDGVDVNTIRAQAGQAIYFAPNFSPSYSNAASEFALVDAAFNWMGWPNNGNNRAPASGQTGTVEAGDASYIKMLNGKDYMAPVSPWFFTHYGAEVSYSKNWMFPGELLWYTRWQKLLTTGPRFIEIVSWNDFGESHYVGPLSSPHADDGASKWCNDMPHNAWLDMAKPWISAFKAGASSVNSFITSDQLFYWYRPQLMNTNCDSTDTCMQSASGSDYYIGRPNGWQTVSDSVFVVSLLTSAGSVSVNSGGNTSTFNAPVGASSYTVPMVAGQQSFSLARNGQTVLSGASQKNITSGCVCGLYNFNAYVGSLPGAMNDALQPAGMTMFANGLRVSTCSATPTLTSTPIVSTTSATATKSSTTSTLTSTISKASTTSSTPTTTATKTTTTTTKTTASSTTTSSLATCNSGSGPGNYGGLCSFCCAYGYCPGSLGTSGPCTCSSTGTPSTPPASNGRNGIPANGLDASYSGLCSFACNHGYCPSGACQYA